MTLSYLHRAATALLIGAAFAVGAVANTHTTRAEPGQAPPPDPRITPGQVIDGWTGLPIPCRCRYQGQAYRLGDVVCMNTHVGTVLTRCELFLNNTSWMPSSQSCTISQATATVVARAAPEP